MWKMVKSARKPIKAVIWGNTRSKDIATLNLSNAIITKVYEIEKPKRFRFRLKDCFRPQPVYTVND